MRHRFVRGARRRGMMRYLVGLVCACALGVSALSGCSESDGANGGGAGGSGGTAGTGGAGGSGGTAGSGGAGGSGGTGGATRCTTNEPCNGYDCNMNVGYCRTSCMALSDCDFDHVCNYITNECELGAPCVDDSECGGYQCVEWGSGYCRVSCIQESNCAETHTCTPWWTCAALIPCSDDAPCGAYTCDLGKQTCFVACWSDDQCAAGYSCTDDRCVLTEAMKI